MTQLARAVNDDDGDVGGESLDLLGKRVAEEFIGSEEQDGHGEPGLGPVFEVRSLGGEAG